MNRDEALMKLADGGHLMSAFHCIQYSKYTRSFEDLKEKRLTNIFNKNSNFIKKSTDHDFQCANSNKNIA